MVGLVVWAHSFCRSTLAFYEGLASAYNVPLKIFIWKQDTSKRDAVGYANNEFSHIDYRFILNDRIGAIDLLDCYKEWHHIFGTYQKGELFREILLRAKKLGCRAAVASEAPCNMEPPLRSIIKSIYLSTVLKYEVRKQINSSDFIINFSGDDDIKLRSIGWQKINIINCGYYSPPLLKSAFSLRDTENWSNFTILMTGRLEWHRNPMVLLKAMRILKLKGVSSKAIITQDGPLLERVRRYVNKHKLSVILKGFVTYDELLHLYQTCSCFVASGRSEPWGIRVNDALHCGSPLVVSEGMGAKKIVKDYGCGLVFSNNNPDDLANKLEYLITDKPRYLAIVNKVKQASLECLPVAISSRIADEIRSQYISWR